LLAEEEERRAIAGVEDEPSPPAPTVGVIEREALRQVLDRGLPIFLAGVELTPYLDLRQRFLGWEIVRYSHGGVDLRPGDVVFAVNRRRLERPDEVHELWNELRSADAIEVAGERGGKAFVWRFEVVGAPAAAAP
jgi:hypothetical protein